MSERILSGELRSVRIYVGESDKYRHVAVWQHILNKARDMGISGCTVLNAMMGFGAGRRIHADYPPETAIDLPILVEVVDESPRIEAFLKAVQPILAGALVTEERALVHHYQPGPPPAQKKEP